VNVTVPCPKCTRAFAFDILSTPIQRAGREGTPGWWTVLAYYPECPHCREKVEVTDLAGAPPPRLPHKRH
jgi:hypothetical protein